MYFWLYYDVLVYIEEAIALSKIDIMKLVMKNLNNLAKGDEGEEDVHYDIDVVTEDLIEGYELNLDDRHKLLLFKELEDFLNYQVEYILKKFNPYSEKNDLWEFGKCLTKLGVAKKCLLKEIELLEKEGN